MIKDKNTGSLIAETQEEAMWWNKAEEGKMIVKALKHRITKAQGDLKLSAREVHKKFIAGAKAAIKSDKLTTKLQKELNKFFEEKLNAP